ncbi:rhodanese-related sulfurtransferase [Microlunatus panaciterrae]|uniref:Rhodanese-related sulfurtransferase n=1 Tax=Microlunatus panaciterrae TaxID=400768 RepID=A0ABS2RM23_9ACTN|nr:rhodanese-like domain-containing protein [Microlunatus panaciterrae]MBM7798979.1 rhodanese-related sulfurtransferase [Microlunatus panaciterrae]
MTSPNTHLPDTVDTETVLGWMADPDAVTVIDVRSPAEFDTVHITGSYNMPLDLLAEHAPQLATRLDHKVVLVCQSGVRAGQARQRLAAVGMDNLHVLDKGVPGFAAAGGPVVRGRARWALERQVRFVAGSLVVAGVVASRWAPKLVAVAGGIGAGLTISALTDTCTMGRVLSALPYNRGPRAKSGQTLVDELPISVSSS